MRTQGLAPVAPTLAGLTLTEELMTDGYNRHKKTGREADIKKPAARAGETVQACQVTMRTQRMKTASKSL